MSSEEDKKIDDSKEDIKSVPPVPAKIDDSILKSETMSLSIRQGVFGGLSQTLADQFITPYALKLHTSPTQIGIMSSLLGIISPLGQILSSTLMKKNSRRSIIIRGILLQSLMWPLIILLGLFAVNGWLVPALPILLITFYVLYSFFGNTTAPSWFSLMGDIVPDDRRGRYFSKRNLVISAISIAVSVAASILLEFFENTDRVFIGFFIIFSVAFISKLISLFLLTLHYYPHFVIEKRSYVSLIKFIKEIPKENFGTFTMYMTILTFSVQIGAPFVGVYMLEVLNFTYIEFVVVGLSTPLISLFIYPLLGHLSDKYGNAFVLKICGFILPTVPILWIVMNTPLQLILGPQLVSAFVWTGINLSNLNFTYDNISQQQRGFYMAYLQLFNGMGVFFGALLGSFLLNIVPVIFWSVYETLFLISGICRLTISFIFLPRIKEVRLKKVEKK